jgi:hypothetical protein
MSVPSGNPSERVAPMCRRIEIRVRGPVALEDADRLGLRAYAEPAETVLRGTVADRPALHGALERLLADGLELIEVRQLPASSGRPR